MDAKQAIAALGALAQETRLDVFRLLVQAGPDGIAAGAIAEELGVLPASLSFHLQQLVHGGLIEQRRASRNIIYSANFRGMRSLIGYLTENCCARGEKTARRGQCAPALSAASASPARSLRSRATA